MAKARFYTLTAVALLALVGSAGLASASASMDADDATENPDALCIIGFVGPVSYSWCPVPTGPLCVNVDGTRVCT